MINSMAGRDTTGEMLLVTAPRLLDVGGIICSVRDDDAVGVIGPWGFTRSVGYTYVPPTAVIQSPLRGFDRRTP